MTLHVHELSPSNALDHRYLQCIVRIHLAAWLTVPLMRTIYYGPPEIYPGYLAAMLERHSKAFTEEDNCCFAVVIDDALPPDDELASGDDGGAEPGQAPKGKVIAALKYYFVAAPDPSASEGTSSSSGTRTWPPHCNSDLSSWFWSNLVEARQLLTNRLGAHVLVDNLYTDPAHHRRGAGGMLMRHACNAADARGLPSMLEASPGGVGVYRSVGYEPFGEGGNDEKGGIWVYLDRWVDGGDRGEELEEQRIKEFGRGKGDGWYGQVLMVRPAKAKDGAVAKKAPEMGKDEAIVV